MTTHTVPRDVLAYYDDPFGDIVEHLKDEGIVAEDKAVVEMEISIKAGELVEVEVVETEELVAP